MHRITCSASGCSESIDICPEVVGDTSLTAFCQRAQGWGKAKRSSHVYCFAHRTQTERCGPEYNHPFCWGRHNSTSTSSASSTAVPVHFSNATEGRQPGGDPGLESSCGVMSSSDSEVEPEAEPKPKPKPTHFKPEVLETEDVQDGWHEYYVRALRREEGYTPMYLGLEGVGILDCRFSTVRTDSSDLPSQNA